jgi:predicted transcriptional regulator
MRPLDESLNIRLSAAMLAELREIAQRDDRPVGYLIRAAVAERLARESEPEPSAR